MAKCDMCQQKISYKTSTSNLKKHVERKHPTITLHLSEPVFAAKADNVTVSTRVHDVDIPDAIMEGKFYYFFLVRERYFSRRPYCPPSLFFI